MVRNKNKKNSPAKKENQTQKPAPEKKQEQAENSAEREKELKAKTSPNQAETAPPQEVVKKVVKRKAAKKSGKKSKKEEAAIIEAELKEIYAEEGEMPDMTRLERRPRRWWIAGLLTVLLLGAIVAVIYAGWVFWKPWEKPGKQGMSVEVIGPSQVTNGERVIYKIDYQNRDTVPMAYVEIQANLPNGFNLLKAEPAPSDSLTIWEIGSLGIGDRGEIKLEGYFLSELDVTQNLQAIVTYRPANFSSEFQDIHTLSVLPTASRVDFTATGPTKAVPGDELEYEIKFKNTSEFDYPLVEMRVQYPKNFIFTSGEPGAATERGDRWRFENFTSGTEETIKIRGNFSSGGQGLQNTAFMLGAMPNNEFKILKQETLETEVLSGDLVAHLFINGSESNQNITFGENLRFSLTWDNTSNEEMEDIELAVHIEADPDGLLLWDELDMPDGAEGDISDNVIIWNKENSAELEKLEKEGSGVIDFSIPLSDGPAGSGNYEINIWTEAKVGKIGQSEVNRQIQTTPIKMLLNTDIGFSASGRYFNDIGEPLGYGPLPPTVGETTGYRIFWNITNSLNELQDITVKTKLPQNITWTGRKDVEAGEIKFNESTNEVTWTINRLPVSITEITSNFEVSARPREEDVGTFVKLVTESTLEARDAKTGDTLLITTDAISTDIPGDEGALGKGVVVE